ncbi:protein argonaute 2-like [Telopea speciosissima]|uniref:protein argonaute 2-like n=1 Tax=Telopea speciosissima TaxID=54955 RepID=UPI001CC5AADF|nr:protein argonaute 2-like [Telopea speciosissima]
MENYGRGRGRGGGRNPGGGRGGERNPGGGGRGRGQNRDQHYGSNPSNFQSFPAQQREFLPAGQDLSFRQGPATYQGQSGEPRRPISGDDWRLRQGPSSSQGQFAEPTRPASAWVGSPWGSSRGSHSGGGGSIGSGRGGGAWNNVPGSSTCSGSVSGKNGGKWISTDIHSPYVLRQDMFWISKANLWSRKISIKLRAMDYPVTLSSHALPSILTNFLFYFESHSTDPPISELRSLDISRSLPQPPPPESGNIVPVKRPDDGGTSYVRKLHLLVNHFPIEFNHHMTMLQYNIDVEPEMPPKHGGPSRVSNSEIRLVMNKIFSDDPMQFPSSMTAYDGGKIIISAVNLPIGKSRVDVPKGEAVKSYIFSIELVKKLELGKLMDYMNGTLPLIPRAILQGMDLVMKENPKKHCVQVGQGFYSMNYRRNDDLGCGVVACRGFQQSLKLTSQGLALCVDYSVLPFRKPVPVLEFLQQRVAGFCTDRIDNNLRHSAKKELKGLRVTVTHRKTNQKFTIMGLTGPTGNDLTFSLEDRDGINPPQEVRLVDYFRNKYNKEIKFKNLPCLDLGKSGNVPMELCVLVEGQRYPKDQLGKNPATKLKDISLPKPWERMDVIYDLVQAKDGPLGGETIHNFEIEASTEMTQVIGRVIRAPNLKLGDNRGRACKFTPNREDCQWNLLDRTVLEGKNIERWAVLEFSSSDRRFEPNSLIYDEFVHQLMMRCRKLGIHMKNPLFHELSDMRVLSDTDMLRKLLNDVYDKANHQLQILVCPMIERHPGYNALKWICETQVGIVTQCCLSNNCNMTKDQYQPIEKKKKKLDQYLANLALKINTKLGGSNFELFDRLPRLEVDEHVMFIGADVNHPSAGNASSPSAAAVVATVNWPAANKYVAQYRLQKHRTERILEFGEMCLELINKYAELNKVKPKKIIVLRDGVSDSQFDMVLNEELMDIKKAIQCDGYSPTVTLVTAQKRHQTRLFPMDENQGARGGNVFPGTVVDRTIVHPWEYDFYLCSHYGLLGTSKPTHYYCLWDEHKFSSDELQQIINNLCYTFTRCTKPVSLVPPAYYADILALRVRQYYEAWEVDSATSSSSCSSSSISPQFDPKIFKLHSDLENAMFFS